MIPEAAVEAAAIAWSGPLEWLAHSDEWRDDRREDARSALEAAAPHMEPSVADEAFGYAVSAIRGHGDFTTAEAEVAIRDVIDALRPTP